MSGLSFREQAAVALYTMPDMQPEGAVHQAQMLADMCCEKWGHQEETYLKVAGGTFTREAARCLRCGKETK